jgi:hypothetical protein
VKLRALLSNSQGGLLLLPWAILVGLALRAGPYGLGEEGAKALLVAWSIGDAVASAAFTLGTPDVRVILFLPLGFLWPGEVVAAKVLTLLVLAAAAIALYRWRRRDDQAEAALLATGLLLIAPIAVEGVNALSAAPFLLAIFASAAGLSRQLVRERGKLGGPFFAQILFCGAAVSLHPAGLAYPAMLWFTWWKEPPDERHRRYFLSGVPLVVLLALVMRLGFGGIIWGQNPVPSAAAVFGGGGENPLSAGGWIAGLVLMALTAAVAWHERRRLLADLTGGTLLLGVLFGAVAADRTWAVLMLALALYGGLPWLLRACAPLAGRGFILQRGWLWLLLLLICTAFMRANRSDYEAGRHNYLSGQDQLISDFAEGLNSLRAGDGKPVEQANAPTDAKAPGHPSAAILVASSWPARTSIACRCDGLPLPPAAKDPDSQLAMMRGVSYVILGDESDNRALAINFAQLGARIEVLSRRPAGVVLRFRPARVSR